MIPSSCLENIQRRVDEGEPPLLAAYRGSRQVAFAVIATTVVVVAVFAPLIFTPGFIGRVFGELGVTVSGAVILSSFVALSLSPMMCSKLLKGQSQWSASGWWQLVYALRLTACYDRDTCQSFEKAILPYPWVGVPLLMWLIIACVVLLGGQINSESQPAEDRGIIQVNITAHRKALALTIWFEKADAPAGYVDALCRERRGQHASPRAYRADGALAAPLILGVAPWCLADWDDRGTLRSRDLCRDSAKARWTLPGVFGFAGMNQGGMSTWGPPMQFIITGDSYDQVKVLGRGLMVAEARKNPGLTRVDMDYKPTKPQFEVEIDRTRAADLGVSTQAIGQTLGSYVGISPGDDV